MKPEWLTYQSLITDWIKRVFDEATRMNVKERALRVVEEAAELAQACDVERATVHRLVDYVYGRPIGEPRQEIAGIIVTAYAAANALGIDGDVAFAEELERIQRPEVIERIQKRQLEKRAAMVTGDVILEEEEPLVALPFDEEDARLADDGFTALNAARARIVQLESERLQISAAWRKQKEWMRAEPFSREPRACAELDALLTEQS